MARLLLLRHGQSTWNAEGRWQGWADAPLSPVGRAQAESAAAWLAAAGVAFAGAVSSDLSRARHTAEVVAAALGLGAVVVDLGLRERDVGRFSGHTTPEIEHRWPGVLAEWRAGRLEGPPGGEPDVRFAARALGAVARLARAAAGDLLVVTHGGVVRAVERHYGVSPGVTPNLSGRWVEGHADGLRLGEPVKAPLGEDGPVVPTR